MNAPDKSSICLAPWKAGVNVRTGPALLLNRPFFIRDARDDPIAGSACGGEEEYVDALLKEFKPRRQDAREFALIRRVLLIETYKGISVDAALGALPFEERTVERASEWAWEQGRSLIICSAEDLVVHKVFAGRDLDWADTERVLTRQYSKLNLPQIQAELEPLLELKGETEALAKLEVMISRVDRRMRARI